MRKRPHTRGAAKRTKKLKDNAKSTKKFDGNDSEEDSQPLDTKCTANFYRQSEEMIQQTESEVAKLTKLLKLQQSNVEVPHTGNKPSEDNTKSTYLKHIRGLRYFCSLIGILQLISDYLKGLEQIGDYESYLLLHPNPPEPFCPSMNPKTIANFIRFKRAASGEPFILLDSTSQCIDVFGKPVFTMGGWKDPRNVDQCLSALGISLAKIFYINYTRGNARL